MSFYHAIEGIIKSVREERHMRIHISFANLIAVFAYFYGISRTECAIIILICGAVISAELLNTAVERAVDTATKEFSDTAKLAKDSAAGAVLILAAAAVLIGFCVFGDFEKIKNTLIYIFTAPRILLPCLALGAADVLFVIFGGKNDR